MAISLHHPHTLLPGQLLYRVGTMHLRTLPASGKCTTPKYDLYRRKVPYRERIQIKEDRRRMANPPDEDTPWTERELWEW